MKSDAKKANGRKGSKMETVKYLCRALTSGVFLAIIIGIVIKNRQMASEDQRKADVLNSLLAIERNFGQPDSPPKVFVGFGSCVDIFASATSLFKEIGLEPPVRSLEHGVLRNETDLKEEFAFYFQQGAAAERYVADRELFDKLVDASRRLKRPERLGGNAPVIAQRMSKQGAQVVLGAQDAPDLPIDNSVKPSGPQVENSDVHLILEYDKNESFGTFTAPRANRFIIHADRFNPVLAGYDNFQKLFLEENEKSAPAALVIGGLQMMEGYEYGSGERAIYFEKIKSLMSEAKAATRIHFELASFVDETILSDIKENVIPYSDSIGMNEQELPNLLSLMKTGKSVSVATAYPRIASVLDQMREIYELVKIEGYPRLLSRLHVHNIAFQAIMVRKGSNWRKTMSATAISSLTAHRHVCQTAKVNLENARLLMDDSFSRSVIGLAEGRVHLNPEKPVSCWEEEISGDQFKICVAPVLICTDVKQTAGGGDNISGAGLYVQI